MDNKHRWDELLAEIDGRDSPAQQRQREIDKLQKGQDVEYLQEVALPVAGEPNANGRVFSEEVLIRAFEDYPDDPGELVEQIRELHREIADQRLRPDTLLAHPETARDLQNINNVSFEEYSYVNAPADSVSVGRAPGPTEMAPEIADYLEELPVRRFVAPVEIDGEELMASGQPGPIYLENADYGVSVDEMGEAQQMTAPASGLLFGHARNTSGIPNEIALPLPIRLHGEPVQAQTYERVRVPQWGENGFRVEPVSGYDPIGEHRRMSEDRDEDQASGALGRYNPLSRDWDI